MTKDKTGVAEMASEWKFDSFTTLPIVVASKLFLTIWIGGVCVSAVKGFN